MRRILTLILLAPIFIAFAGFMFVNRHSVTVKLDLINSQNPFFAIDIPLYAVALIFMIVGVFIGAVADWLSQGKYRKELRSTRKQNKKLNKESEKLKEQIMNNARMAIDQK